MKPDHISQRMLWVPRFSRGQRLDQPSTELTHRGSEGRQLCGQDPQRRQAGGSAGGAARPATQRDDYCVVLDALGETGAQWPGRYFPFAA